MSFIFSEANVRKNYYRIFVKKAENIQAHPNEPVIANGMVAGVDYPGATAGDPKSSTGMVRELYSNYYEQIGSCDAEPKAITSDVEGLTNNIGNKLGASKSIAIDFVLHDLNGGSAVGANYNDAIALDGTTVNFIFFDENSGTLKKYSGVTVSINLEDTGNNFEKLPIKAEKEKAKITDFVQRYVLAPGSAVTGRIAAYTITTAGEDYVVGDAANQASVSPVGGTGFAATVLALGVDDGIYALNVSNYGTGYAIGDVITLAVGSGSVPVAATLTVTAIA